MKTVMETVAYKILDLYSRCNKCVGDVLIGQQLVNFEKELNSTEQELIGSALHHLESLDYIKFVERPTTGECYELTQQGYDYLYSNSAAARAL